MRSLKTCLSSLTKNKKKHFYDCDLQPFLDRKMPVFWIMGPSGCGKTTLAEMLAKSSKYRLLNIKNLIKEEIVKGQKASKLLLESNTKEHELPIQLLINLIKEDIIHSYENTSGYIIDGFPINLREAKAFERNICKVSLVIYVTLVLDAIFARRITQVGAFNPNQERIQFIKNVNSLNRISKAYEHKLIKIPANYPPEDTCTRLVEYLEDYWGYKFLRLYNKNQ